MTVSDNRSTPIPLPADEAEANGAPITEDEACRLVWWSALNDRRVGPVGLELEGHVVEVDCADRSPAFATLEAVAADLAALPGGGRITFEPGGQLEVSSACQPDAGAVIAAMRADVAAVRSRLAREGLAWVLLGADPVRPARLVNPTSRYAAMQAWFTAGGPEQGAAGSTMMCSTAALQINLETGQPDHWALRVDRAQRLAPVLTAITAGAAFVAGQDTGWWSARQQAWSQLDPLTSAPLLAAQDPAAAWTERALAAPVMMVPTGGGDLMAADRRRSLRDWLGDPGGWPPATLGDVRRHLTTLFPPVRLRGWLELRSLDSMPDSWWPAVAAAVIAWMDAPELASTVDALLTAEQLSLETAARVGLQDLRLRRTAQHLLELALAAVSLPERDDLAALLDLVAGGRTPASLVANDMRRRGAATVWKELARA